MGRKFPWMKFHPGDWLKDPRVSQLRPATRGIWMDAICAMHELDQCGQLSGTVADLARICRCTPNELRGALDDLKLRNAAEIHEQKRCHGLSQDNTVIVTLTNRRMRREWTGRKSNAERQQRGRLREKVSEPSECHVNVTPLSHGESKKPESNNNKESVVVVPAAPQKSPLGISSKAVQLLLEIGVTPKVIEGFSELLEPQVRLLIKSGEKRIERRRMKPDDMAGYVVAGIRNSYVIPSDLKPPATRHDDAAKQATQRRKETQQQAKQADTEQAKTVAIVSALSPEERDRLKSEVLGELPELSRARLEKSDPITSPTLRALIISKLEKNGRAA